MSQWSRSKAEINETSHLPSLSLIYWFIIVSRAAPPSEWVESYRSQSGWPDWANFCHSDDLFTWACFKNYKLQKYFGILSNKKVRYVGIRFYKLKVRLHFGQFFHKPDIWSPWPQSVSTALQGAVSWLACVIHLVCLEAIYKLFSVIGM
jgi:hypothetical protein